MSSRRQYIDSAYLTEYMSGESVNSDFSSVDDLISSAEEIIDAYVGYQRKWFQTSSNSASGIYTPPDHYGRIAILKEVRGRVQSVQSTTQFTLQQYQCNVFQLDFFATCWIEIIGGTGAGQTNHVTSSTYPGVITVEGAWTTALDTTSIYRIYQLGKFPRQEDVFFDSLNQPVRYYKTIPDAVRRATAAQCVFMNRQGRQYFEDTSGLMSSEHLENYSYTRNPALISEESMYVAPEAKSILRGIRNVKGKIRI